MNSADEATQDAVMALAVTTATGATTTVDNDIEEEGEGSRGH